MGLTIARTRALFAAAFVAALATAVPLAHADTLQFSAPADTPMISLTREHGMMRGLPDTPLVQVFSDGRVRVDRPAYMIGAGVHEFRLEGAALTELVASLATLVDMDAKAIAQRRAALERATGTRFVTMDHTTTRIELRFDALGRNGAPARSIDQTVSMPDVQIDAERFSELEELATLARAERALLALFQRPLEAGAAVTGGDHE